jgi:CubicO group peptidase (beta-lactamase class C family)
VLRSRERAATPGATDELSRLTFERLLEQALERHELAGAQVIVWHRDRLIHSSCCGYTDTERRKPIDVRTLFRVASMTKPVTSVAILLLMEAGKLGLGDPIARWIPELAAPRVLRHPAADPDDCVPAQRPITVLDLLTHRSGLAYAITAPLKLGAAYTAAVGTPFHNVFAYDEWIRRLATLPLIHQPGTCFHYGHSTDVLGVLIQRISGQPFETFLREQIFGPLQMHDATFALAEEDTPRLAGVFQRSSGSTQLMAVPWLSRPTDSEFVSAGQGLIVTGADYLRFARLLMNRGQLDDLRLLAEESIALMTRNWLTEAQRAIATPGAPLWRDLGFGLGVSVALYGEGKNAAEAPGSFGWPSILGSWWQVDPAEQLIILYFSGVVSLGGPQNLQLITSNRIPFAIRDAVYAQLRD